MNHCEIKKMIKDGNVQSLEEKLLNGEGYKLIGHYSTSPKIKTFLQSVPIYIVNIPTHNIKRIAYNKLRK